MPVCPSAQHPELQNGYGFVCPASTRPKPRAPIATTRTKNGISRSFIADLRLRWVHLACSPALTSRYYASRAGNITCPNPHPTLDCTPSQPIFSVKLPEATNPSNIGFTSDLFQLAHDASYARVRNSEFICDLSLCCQRRQARCHPHARGSQSLEDLVSAVHLAASSAARFPTVNSLSQGISMAHVGQAVASAAAFNPSNAASTCRAITPTSGTRSGSPTRPQ